MYPRPGLTTSIFVNEPLTTVGVDVAVLPIPTSAGGNSIVIDGGKKLE